MTRRSAILFGGYLVIGLGLTWATATLTQRLGPAPGIQRTVLQGPGFDGTELMPPTVAEAISLAFLDADPTLPRRFISVRWSGVWNAGAGGAFDIYAGSDDRVVVTVDGRLVSERSPAVGMHTVAAPIRLSGGLHDLEVLYEQHGGGYSLNLQWAPEGGTPRPFSASHLFPARPDATTMARIQQFATLDRIVVAYWLIPPLLLLAVVGAPVLVRSAVAGWQLSRIVVLSYPTWALLAGIVMAAIAVRLGYLFVATASPGFVWIDPDRYMVQARLLTNSGQDWRWSIDAFRYFEFFKAPLYPVFLAIFTFLPEGQAQWWAASSQSVLATVAVFAVFVMTQRLHSTRAALIAAAATALYFRNVVIQPMFMQERIYLPLLVTALAVLSLAVTGRGRPRQFGLAGALLGLAALARSMPVYFVGPAALAWWVMKRDRRAAVQAGALLVGFGVTTLPYCLWLSVEAGQFILIENIGVFPFVRGDPALRDFMSGPTPTTIELARLLWYRFSSAPIDFLQEKANLVGLAFRVSTGRWLESTASLSTAVIASSAKMTGHVFGDLLFLSAAVLAPFGMVVARHRRLAVLLGLWIAIHLGMTALATYAGPRFREPIEAPLFALSACVLAGHRRMNRPGWLTGSAVAAVAVATFAVPSFVTSVAGRADYGVRPWTTTATGRATTTVGGAGFNVRPSDGWVEFEIAGLAQLGADVVEVRVDGTAVDTVEVGAADHRLRYPTATERFAYVELRPPEAATLTVNLFDHPAGVGR